MMMYSRAEEKNAVDWSGGSQSGVPQPAASAFSGNLLENNILLLHLGPEFENLVVGPEFHVLKGPINAVDS